MCAFSFSNLMSYLNERCDAERGGAYSPESRQQNRRCPCLLADPTPQQPGRAQVKTCFLSQSLAALRAALTLLLWACVLRVQDSEGETVDSYVPSSSPESVADLEVSRFPDLSFVKLEPVSPCPSPTLAVMPAARGKGHSPLGC